MLFVLYNARQMGYRSLQNQMLVYLPVSLKTLRSVAVRGMMSCTDFVQYQNSEYDISIEKNMGKHHKSTPGSLSCLERNDQHFHPSPHYTTNPP